MSWSRFAHILFAISSRCGFYVERRISILTVSTSFAMIFITQRMFRTSCSSWRNAEKRAHSKQSKKVESIDESWTSEREKFCYCVYEENVPILTIQVVCINILLKKIAFFSKQNSVRRETNKMLTSLTTRQIFTLVVFFFFDDAMGCDRFRCWIIKYV